MYCKINSYSIYLLMFFLAAYTFGKDPNALTNDSNESKPVETKRKIVTGQKAWALGCGGLLNEKNHQYHNSLSTADLTQSSIRKIKKIIEDDWGVTNREDLYKNFLWLEQGGQSAEFNYLGELLTSTDEVEYDEILKRFENEPQVKLDINQIKQRLTITKQYYNELGDKSILGWDYCRYIMLCRWGYMTGLISEDEAWEKIMPVARELQKTFDSWEDLGRNYIIGRKFWSYARTAEDGEAFDDALMRMLEMRTSPWVIYPWDMDLTEGENVENQKNN